MTQPKITTKYRVSGPAVLPFQQQEGSIVDKVPPAYYKVEEHPFIGFYLTRVSDNVEIPEQIFGSTLPRARRIFESYDSGPSSLGVGLFGKKGAGKSLLASVVAHQAIERGIPVIDVSDSFVTNPQYLEFINSIDECVIIFDEFLKHLSKLSPTADSEESHHDRQRNRQNIANDRQDEMLTFFQGTHNRKRLVMLIDNQSHMLSEFLTDRPGRMRYMYNYEGVEREVVEALAEHHGIPADRIDTLVVYSQRFRVSFDVINEVIKEWVKYPQETLEQITEILNVPTLRPDVRVKARVLSIKSESIASIQPKTGLASISTTGKVDVEVLVPNPLYNTTPMSEKEQMDGCEYDHMSREEYLNLFKEPLDSRGFRFHIHDLVAVKGNQEMYESDGVTLVIERMETQVVNQSEKWADAL